MPYTRKTISEIPKWVYCPFCNDVDHSYKNKNALLNHIQKCSEFEGDIDNIEEEQIDDDTTIQSFIEQRLYMINIAKEFIKSNELDVIKDQSFAQLFTHIKNRCGQFIGNSDSEIDWAVSEIYTFFFGDCEDIDRIMVEHMKKRLFSSN